MFFGKCKCVLAPGIFHPLSHLAQICALLLAATSMGKADVTERQEIRTLHTQVGGPSASFAYYPEVISTQFLPLALTVCFTLMK